MDSGGTPLQPGRGADVLQLLRTYAEQHQELTRHLARALEVHTTDAVAVAEILWAQSARAPLSPARLAQRIGLTTGATATLLNRLEASDVVVRSREATDRRVVTLRLTPAAETATRAFFTPTGAAVQALLDGYDDDALGRVEAFLTDVVHAVAARNDALREASPGQRS